MSTPDKYTLVVELQAPMPSWIELIKSPASPMTIIPSEECDKEPNKVSPIGTGPFEFMDWDGVTQLRIKRNNKYVPNESYEGRDGYCGKRTAYLDQVTFRVVTEGSARVAGLQSGEFHIVDEVPVPAAKRLQADSLFTIYDRMPLSINVVPVNVARSPTDNILVRRAIQQAINSEEIMAIATEGNYRLNPSFVYPGSEYYPRNADKLIYNAADSDRAKALLKEANYKGEEIVILSSSDIASLKEVAVVMSEQLKAAGMKTRIDILDWPGANARRSDPTSHNLFSTAYAIQPLLGPFQYQRLMATPSNWSFYKEDQRFDEIWTKLLAATHVDERRTVWEQIEELLNENVYQLKIGDRGIKQVATTKLKNFKPYDAIRMWDVWLA
jgi:peptide/nickel transport system substrate-binding protein